VLDEPSNFLDREALGGLAVAIRDWAGAVVIISHNEEFIGALCSEIWNVDNGRMTHKGKASVVEDAFDDGRSPKGSGANTPVGRKGRTPAASAAATPAASASATPAASGDEKAADGTATPPLAKKKKKMTRNQIKAQECVFCLFYLIVVD
jgi:elongation factor 3